MRRNPFAPTRKHNVGRQTSISHKNDKKTVSQLLNLPSELIRHIMQYLGLFAAKGLLLSCSHYYIFIWSILEGLYINQTPKTKYVETIINNLIIHARGVSPPLRILSLFTPHRDKLISSLTVAKLCHFTNLERIDINRNVFPITDANVDFLTYFPKLKHMSIEAEAVSAVKLVDIVNKLQLQTFNFTNVGGLSRTNLLAALATHPVTKLLIHSRACTISSDNINQLTRMEQLTRLFLCMCQGSSEQYLTAIGCLTNLTDLTFTAIDINNLDFVNNLTKLTRLDVGECHSLMDQHLLNLNHLPHIQQLCLHRPNLITAHGIASLPQTLTMLSLVDWQYLTDDMLGELLALPSLQQLVISYAPALSNRGMGIITRHPTIHTLTLEYLENINDSGILILSNMLALETLSIHNCHQITAMAVDKLRVLHHNAWINSFQVIYH